MFDERDLSFGARHDASRKHRFWKSVEVEEPISRRDDIGRERKKGEGANNFQRGESIGKIEYSR